MKRRKLSEISIIKPLVFVLMSAFLICGHISALQAAEPASAAVRISAGENFFDTKTKTLTVSFDAPAGTQSALIAASYDNYGSMIEKAVKDEAESGNNSFVFSKPALKYRVFAVNRQTLSPVSKDLSLKRTISADDVSSEEFTLNMPKYQQETADALEAVAACAADAQKKLDAVKALTTDKVTVSYNAVKWIHVTGYTTESVNGVSVNTISYNEVDEEYVKSHPDEDCRRVIDEDNVLYKEVTGFEAVYGNDERYEEAENVIKEAQEAYELYVTAAAVLDRMAGFEESYSYYPPDVCTRRAEKLVRNYEVTEGISALKMLAEQAGMDAEKGKLALDEVMISLGQMYSENNVDIDSVITALDSAYNGKRIRMAGGAGLLTKAGFLLKDAELAVDIRYDRTLLIFDPDNANMAEGYDPKDDEVCGTLMFYGNGLLSYIGDLRYCDPGNAFDRYELASETDRITASVTELEAGDLEAEQGFLNLAGETIFASDLAGSGTLSQNMAAFCTAAAVSESKLQDIIGEYTSIEPVRDMFASLMNGRVAETKGLTVVEEGSDYDFKRYTVNDERKKVGLFEEFSYGTKVYECMYTDDDSRGFKGITYSKTWQVAPGQKRKRLTEEVYYSVGGGEGPSSGINEEASGEEEPAGTTIIKNYIRKVITYYTEDGRGETLKENQGQSVKKVKIDRFETDRYDYFFRNGIDAFDNITYEHRCWFNLLERDYYFEDGVLYGKPAEERKIVETQEGPGRCVTYWDETGQKVSMTIYGWDPEGLEDDEFGGRFGEFMVADVIYQESYYVKAQVERDYNGLPESFRKQIIGHLCFKVGFDKYELYEPGSWYSKYKDEHLEEHTISLPAQKDLVQFHGAFNESWQGDDRYGWRYVFGSGQSRDYTYIVV